VSVGEDDGMDTGYSVPDEVEGAGRSGADSRADPLASHDATGVIQAVCLPDIASR